jgi:hypothetical protein
LQRPSANQELIRVKLFHVAWGEPADVQLAQVDEPVRSVAFRRIIPRLVHGPHTVDGEPSAVKQLLDLAARKETQVRPIEQSG